MTDPSIDNQPDDETLDITPTGALRLWGNIWFTAAQALWEADPDTEGEIQDWREGVEWAEAEMSACIMTLVENYGVSAVCEYAGDAMDVLGQSVSTFNTVNNTTIVFDAKKGEPGFLRLLHVLSVLETTGVQEPAITKDVKKIECIHDLMASLVARLKISPVSETSQITRALAFLAGSHEASAEILRCLVDAASVVEARKASAASDDKMQFGSILSVLLDNFKVVSSRLLKQQNSNDTSLMVAMGVAFVQKANKASEVAAAPYREAAEFFSGRLSLNCLNPKA